MFSALLQPFTFYNYDSDRHSPPTDCRRSELAQPVCYPHDGALLLTYMSTSDHPLWPAHCINGGVDIYP